MTQGDFSGLERVEFDATADLYRAAPDGARAAHAIEWRAVGPATCMTARGIEPAGVFRRAVGLGVGRPASETELDAALAHMNGHARGHRYVVPVAPQSQPSELGSWLRNRGFVRGYAWMKFSRRCDDPPRAACDLEIRVIGSERAAEFGSIVVSGFGLPASAAPWIGALAGRKNWLCVIAIDAGESVAAGAAYVGDGYAWLGLGATLASHRRRGAQNALLARRLVEAAARGARVAVTETGERVPDKPSGSYRNILRAGFEERYLRLNYLSPAIPAC